MQALCTTSEAKCPERVEGRFMYFLYILECSDGSLYTGITNNLDRRFQEHASGIGGRYTRSKHILKIVYTEEFSDRASALRREAQVKGWRREKKIALFRKTT
ncbi:MAG: GIY-YIG nuclease family protein [Candidatus Pacebacteria bacterium]|nr:GIY-YIG nuclease family protein [Candidatus Paceibacterota bacterium]